MEAHTAPVRPLVEGIRYELRPIVDHERLRVAELCAHFVERASNARSADASLYDGARGAAAEVIDDGQNAEAVPVARAVGHEIHRPALAGRIRHGWSGSGSRCEPLASLDAHREAFAAIDAIHALVMDDDALASKRRYSRRYPKRGR
jgi:hypothetical protein